MGAVLAISAWVHLVPEDWQDRAVLPDASAGVPDLAHGALVHRID